MTRTALAVSLVFLTLGVFTSQATQAAKMGTGTFNIEGEPTRFVKLTGEIITGDDFRLLSLIEKYEDGPTPIELVVLNSEGGDVEESHEMVDTIVDNELSTMVLPKEKCLSACFALFAAGDERILYPDSIVGVHRARVDGDIDNFGSDMMTMQIEMVYHELDVPNGIIKKMKSTPSSKVYYLNKKEMRAMSTETSQFD